ncbi:MAG: rRNA pseudouridine synthase [Candidatus Omnitrophica bacterium]|nr:rRNA pseudouridine synthase [Candidatus Omnitrophota bacterium]
MRLHKFLAHAGVASRRASELFILAGRVRVNGHLVRELGTQITPGEDRVTVDDKDIKAPRQRLYVALNKPPGYICSRHDPQKRQSLMDLLPKEWSRLYSVGRLDWESEGLIFLTDDGQFCLGLTHPRYGVGKTYRVTVEGRVAPETLARMKQGVRNRGEELRADKARLLECSKTRSIIELELSEGKNREVRRLLEAQGLRVTRLQRTQIGRIKLGELPLGKWRRLTKSEIKSLLPEL